MTSNLGANIIQEHFEKADNDSLREAYRNSRAEVFELFRQTFRPEFLNTVDEIIMFKPLTKKELRYIVKLQIIELEKMLDEQELQISLTDEVIDWLTEYGFDPQYGARPLKRLIQREITNQLSKKILSGDFTAESVLQIDVVDDRLIFYTVKDEEFNIDSLLN